VSMEIKLVMIVKLFIEDKQLLFTINVYLY
jgi:hypothetical protein